MIDPQTVWASFAPDPNGFVPNADQVPLNENSDQAVAATSQNAVSGPVATSQAGAAGIEQNTLAEQPVVSAPRGAREGLIEPTGGGISNPQSPSWISVHGQVTLVDEIHNHFPAAYTGPNSLLQVEPSAMSETTTLFLDTRIWEGGEPADGASAASTASLAFRMGKSPGSASPNRRRILHDWRGGRHGVSVAKRRRSRMV
jgi:hypothetical protein